MPQKQILRMLINNLSTFNWWKRYINIHDGQDAFDGKIQIKVSVFIRENRRNEHTHVTPVEIHWYRLNRGGKIHTEKNSAPNML